MTHSHRYEAVLVLAQLLCRHAHEVPFCHCHRLLEAKELIYQTFAVDQSNTMLVLEITPGWGSSLVQQIHIETIAVGVPTI